MIVSSAPFWQPLRLLPANTLREPKMLLSSGDRRPVSFRTSFMARCNLFALHYPTTLSHTITELTENAREKKNRYKNTPTTIVVRCREAKYSGGDNYNNNNNNNAVARANSIYYYECSKKKVIIIGKQ